MASTVSSNPALNLIMAARDISAGPSGVGAASTFSSMLERNLRQHDQAATRPREAPSTPAPTPAQHNHPSSAEQPRPTPAQTGSTLPAPNDTRPPQGNQTSAEDATALPGDAYPVKETMADATANEPATSLPQDEAALPANPADNAPDVLLNSQLAPDPAGNETAVAASLAALAPVLAGIAALPASDAAAPEAELPATPARTLASTLMARLFGAPASATTGADISEGANTQPATTTTTGAVNAKTDFAALMAGKQPPAATASTFVTTDFAVLVAGKPPATVPARITPELAAGVDPAARLSGMSVPLTTEPGAAALLHTAGVTGSGVARVESPLLQQLQVATPVGQRAWAEDVGTKLTWMVGRGESRAELVLTPPSLGKVGVSIHINGDQTTAHFIASTPAAREALEQAMPRLREVMQQSGINLGQADVSTSGQHQARQDAAPHRSPYPLGNATGANRDDAPLPLTSSTHWVRSGTGVIDTFA